MTQLVARGQLVDNSWMKIRWIRVQFFRLINKYEITQPFFMSFSLMLALGSSKEDNFWSLLIPLESGRRKLEYPMTSSGITRHMDVIFLSEVGEWKKYKLVVTFQKFLIDIENARTPLFLVARRLCGRDWDRLPNRKSVLSSPFVLSLRSYLTVCSTRYLGWKRCVYQRHRIEPHRCRDDSSAISDMGRPSRWTVLP